MAFITFEILLWILFALSLVDANKRWGLNKTLLFFVPLFIYGWILEASAIGIFQRYEYGDGFFVTLFGAPLCIAAGWAAITYSGFCIAQTYTQNHFKIAAFTALWGLSIDFSMDGLAVLMGYWTWFAPADVVLPYFDVPVSNFIGWFIILSFFSFFHLRWQDTKIRKMLFGFDAVIPALPALLIAIAIMLESEYERLFITFPWWLMLIIFIVPLVVILSVWLLKKPNLSQFEDTQSFKVPLLISHALHGFFFIMSIYVGITSGDWRYLIVALVAGVPLLAHGIGSKQQGTDSAQKLAVN